MYNYIDDGTVVALHVLVNADVSLVGLKFANCEIKEITVGEMAKLIASAYGGREVALFYESISSHLLPIELKQNQNLTVNNLDELTLIVLEERGGALFTSIFFFKTIKLFKAVDLYPCYFMNYRIEKSQLKWGGYSKATDYPHGMGFNKCKFSMTEEEKKKFPAWFEEYRSFAFPINMNEQFGKVLRTYMLSYYVGFPDLEFVMLFVVLEMIFGSRRSMISYQISRGIALLLSNNDDEVNSMIREAKKLYRDRSKYVHNGVPIKRENLFELREIVRKTILRLIEMGFHYKEKNFKDLRDILAKKGRVKYEKRKIK